MTLNSVHVKWLKSYYMCTHLWELSENYPKNTNTTGLKWFSKIFASSYFGWKISLSIWRVKSEIYLLSLCAGPLIGVIRLMRPETQHSYCFPSCCHLWDIISRTRYLPHVPTQIYCQQHGNRNVMFSISYSHAQGCTNVPLLHQCNTDAPNMRQAISFQHY